MKKRMLSEHNFAGQIKKLRYSRTPKISQRQMADMLGISRSAYASYETGRRMPPVYVVIAAANRFGINADELLSPQKGENDENLTP